MQSPKRWKDDRQLECFVVLSGRRECQCSFICPGHADQKLYLIDLLLSDIRNSPVMQLGVQIQHPMKPIVFSLEVWLGLVSVTDTEQCLPTILFVVTEWSTEIQKSCFAT
jgi:hypothetical protein